MSTLLSAIHQACVKEKTWCSHPSEKAEQLDKNEIKRWANFVCPQKLLSPPKNQIRKNQKNKQSAGDLMSKVSYLMERHKDVFFVIRMIEQGWFLCVVNHVAICFWSPGTINFELIKWIWNYSLQINFKFVLIILIRPYFFMIR